MQASSSARLVTIVRNNANRSMAVAVWSGIGGLVVAEDNGTFEPKEIRNGSPVKLLLA
jgi:hypothetical protein